MKSSRKTPSARKGANVRETAAPKHSAAASTQKDVPTDRVGRVRAIKERFDKARKLGRAATASAVLDELKRAYAEATERVGRQPEFPLVISPAQPWVGDRTPRERGTA